MKELLSFKEVAPLVVEAVAQPKAARNLSIRHIGRTRSATSARKKGHPANHCPKKSKGSKSDDDKSLASTASSVKKMTKEFKSMKKAFTTVNTQLEKMKEDESDISESEGEEESSHFQFGFAQLEQEFEPRIAQLFKQANSSKLKLDLTEVILLDSQSTMDLFCNRSLVESTFDSGSSVRLKSNGGTMVITRKAKIAGYHKSVWFSTRAITNIIALSNLIKQYRVTYDSKELSFVVHRESAGKPNMEFRMHESGLHYYDPRTSKDYTFVSKESDNWPRLCQHCLGEQSRFHQETDKGCRGRTDSVHGAELPIHEGFQVDDSQQPDQELSSDSRGCRCCP